MQPPFPSTPAHATLDQSPLALTPEPLPYTSPLFLCSIPAGFPSPATDYIEDGLDLNEYLVRHKAASFLFRVQGHSMRDAGIVDGDKVVVDRSIEPQHNQIVIAVVDGEYTIKRLYRKNGRVELRSENPAFKPICFKAESQLEIWGVVVGVVRRYQYKKCGVMLMELTVKAQRQETLFDDVAARDRAAKTMAVMDSINRVWGRGTLRSGAAGNSKRWAMRSENRSPRYTTQWDELPVAN